MSAKAMIYRLDTEFSSNSQVVMTLMQNFRFYSSERASDVSSWPVATHLTGATKPIINTQVYHTKDNTHITGFVSLASCGSRDFSHLFRDSRCIEDSGSVECVNLLAGVKWADPEIRRGGPRWERHHPAQVTEPHRL